MEAQSRGEWPGARRTLRLGLEGLVVCVGGGASEEDGGARVEREGVGPRLGRGLGRDGAEGKREGRR